MASFTDQLTAFNPYISQVPVDDYTRVGMIKQQQYDQGVQKVQGDIDSVAGLEVAHPEQKAYLQQRVGQLQSQVSGIVQQDFSNQQIVNSVGALTNKIASDPIIQNAVYSTQNLKANNAKQKQAQDEGKSNPANDYAYQNQVQSWLSNKDVTSTFSGQYVPFTDVNKKLIDVFNKTFSDGKNADERLEELPYVMNADGSQKLDPVTHQPILNYEKIVKTYKGVSPERIQNIIESTLDENDRRQLDINGRYEYRNYDKQALKDTTDKSYQRMFDQTNSAISGLLTERNANASDPDKVAQIDAKIASLKNGADNLQDRYKSDVNFLDKNPEAYKSSLYKTNWESQFSTGFSYAQYSKKSEANPGWLAANTERYQKAELESKAIEFKIQEERNQIAEKKADAQMEHLRLIEKKMGLDGEETDPNAGLKIGNVGVPTSYENAGEDPDITSSRFQAKVLTDQKNLEGLDLELLAKKNSKDGFVTQVDEKQPDGSFKTRYDWSRKAPDGHIRSNEEMEKMKVEATNVLNTYRNAPSPDYIIQSWNQESAMAKNLNDNQTFKVNQINAEADKNSNITQFLSNIPTVTLTSGSDTKYQISPTEILGFKNKLDKVLPTSNGGQAPINPMLNDGLANQLFTTPKEKFLYSMFKEHWQGKDPQGMGTIFNLMDRVGAAQNNPQVKAAQQDATDEKNRRYMKINPVTNPEEFPIKTDDKNRDIVYSTARTVLSNVLTSGKGNAGRNFDADKINQALGAKDDKSTTLNLVSHGDGQIGIGIINNSVNGGKEMEILLPEEQAERIFGNKIAKSAFSAINQNLFLTKDDGRNTTNVRDGGEATAMPLQNPNINDYRTSFDVEAANGGYQVWIYATDKSGKTTKFLAPFKGLINQFAVTSSLSGVDDNVIREQIKKQEDAKAASQNNK